MALLDPVEIAANPAYAEAMAAMPSDIVWKPLSEYQEADFGELHGPARATRRFCSPAETLLALLRLRDRIQSVPLYADDDTTIGSKNTECSWGLCDPRGLYPNPISHTWPLAFLKNGKEAPKTEVPRNDDGYFTGSCPMDERLTGDAKPTGNGCFYTCRIFQAKRGETVGRKQALELCDVAIQKVRDAILEVREGR